jgi:hypothetical protein
MYLHWLFGARDCNAGYNALVVCSRRPLNSSMLEERHLHLCTSINLLSILLSFLSSTKKLLYSTGSYALALT